MNETLQIIANRYSCRDYTDTPLTAPQLEALRAAALQSPSAMNCQPWQIIEITNKDILAELEAEAFNTIKNTNEVAYQRIVSRGGLVFYNCPCMYIIAVDKSQSGWEMTDLGIVAENIVLAAASMDLASVHCAMINFSFAGEKADELKKKLQFKDGYECGLAVLLGEAKAPVKPHAIDSSKLTIIE